MNPRQEIEITTCEPIHNPNWELIHIKPAFSYETAPEYTYTYRYIGGFNMGDHLISPATLWLQTINFKIEKVIFNDPATIVLWKDGTKTIVKCQEGDTYSKELGLAMCISKKALGNKGRFNETFKEWAYER